MLIILFLFFFYLKKIFICPIQVLKLIFFIFLSPSLQILKLPIFLESNKDKNTNNLPNKDYTALEIRFAVLSRFIHRNM